MKKFIYLLCIVAVVGCIQASNHPDVSDNKNQSSAQQTTSANPEADKLAPFKILTVDNHWITNADLKPNKPVLLIYFAPDCGHCHALLKKLQPQFKALSNMQVLLITWHPVESLQAFYKDYKLSAYPNIIVGTEGYGLQVQKFYQIKETPYTAVFDHKGKLVQAFEKAPEVKELLAAVKKA